MFRQLMVMLLFAGSAVAQTPQSVTVLVPIVGNVVGPSAIRWKTDASPFDDVVLAYDLGWLSDADFDVLAVAAEGLPGA